MSENTNWTKGPWKFGKELTAHWGEWLISKDAGDKGGGIAIAETRPGSGCEIADARLIAAAPELYDALVKVLGDYTDWDDHDTDWATEACRALAKARGEQ